MTDAIVKKHETDENYKIAQELQHLMLSLTYVEEAAIRSVVPLVSIVRLLHGSLKAGGNTTCVWQES